MTQKRPQNLDIEHVRSLCKIGEGAACCSFLVCGPNGFECAKDPVNQGILPLLTQRREQKAMVALADNCSGPPSFVPLNTDGHAVH